MIGLLAKVPFHSQIRRALPELAAALESAAAETEAMFGASRLASDESFALVFDEAKGCSRLRAAEAARSFAERFRQFAPRLHGYALIIGASAPETPNAEEFLRSLKESWYLVEGDGLFIEAGAAPLFDGYLDIEGDGRVRKISGFRYADRALPSGYRPPSFDESSLDRFIDEVGRHSIGESEAYMLVAVGPGSVPEHILDAALAALYKNPSDSFLHLHAAVGVPSPYGPFLSGFTIPPRENAMGLLSSPERKVLAELSPIAELLRSSPYRQDYSQTIRTRLFLYAAARLRLYARERRAQGLPAIIVLEGLDRYPAPSLELTRRLLLDEGLKEEGLVVFGTAAIPPEGLEEVQSRSLSAPPPSPATLAAAAKKGAEALAQKELAPTLTALAEGDAFRLGLALRLASSQRLPLSHVDTEELAAAALSTFPPEFAELVFALALAEEVLDDERLENFLDAAGFVAGIRPLLFDELVDLGFLAAGPRPRLLRAEAVRSIGSALPDKGESVRAAFTERLLSLHRERSILPSTALYENIATDSIPQAMRGLFFLDCLAADALFGSAEAAASARKETASAQALKAPSGLAGLGPFFRAYAASDAEEASVALDRLEAEARRPEAEPLEVAMATLARASDEYARGEAQAGAARARPALIALHGLGARRAEARAHRLLGLAALAQSQVQEGAAYLENAYEIASESPDPFECFFASYSEAGALLVLGDLRHASERGQDAADWARKAFRADWEAACDFLSGRIAFEFGRYDEAGNRFGRVRSEARVYGEEETAIRAEAWAGRAASFANESEQAHELLSHRSNDAESLWFLAELEGFEGNTEGAARHSRDALALVKKRRYFPADSLSWASGFECLESRALGFGRKRSYLEDQIGAFAAFSAALAGGGSSPLLEIEARTREDRLATLHPEAHLYHFYCYRALLAAGGGPLDPATVLSKSFKALQLRTARMDEAALKDEYMEGNRWNREILAEARKFKLI